MRSVLKRSGWKRGRDDASQELAFRQELGEAWLPNAAPLVRSLGGLWTGANLGISSQRLAEVLEYRPRMEKMLGVRCCPLGYFGYMSTDEANLWIDERDRFYNQDREGFLFLADGIPAFLRVALLRAKPASPPAELVEILERCWHWDAFPQE